MAQIDPITVELIQNRLTQIGLEAGIAMQKTAASPAVVDAKDLGFNIADHLARTILYSIWMPRHGTTLSYMLRATIDRFGMDGIQPGDMILTNNPYDGALHLFDLAVIAPVHYEGELIAWTGCATHHMDVRGMHPGFSPEATEWFQEGIVFRPIKLVERGHLRQDIFDFYLDNVRIPRYQGLDLKAQIAANNVANDKILELTARYGVETLKACYDEIIRFSEMKTRKRIQELPDGEYKAFDQMDFDGRVYSMHCTLIVKDDTLTFDFAGTDPQSETFINSTLACSVANVHNIVTCLLIPDIAANEGCFRPITVTIPEGTVLNSQPPVACSGASTIGGWKAQILALEALSKAVVNSPHAWRANAAWGSGMVMPHLYGRDRAGHPYLLNSMDGCMQGGGARATKDGFDVANIAGSTNTSIPDVEAIEQRFPVMYLYRRMERDTGGPGKFRGGLAGGWALKLHKVEKADSSVGYIGRDIPPKGLDGGEPGATCLVGLKRETNVNQMLKRHVPALEEIEGTSVILPHKSPSFEFQNDDVCFIRCQGGGGYGDPLTRDPALVLRDVLDGYVSVEQAERAYGVVLDQAGSQVDENATEAQRARLRAEREQGAERES